MDKVDSDKLFTDKVKIKRALISVTDKTNIEKLDKVLEDYNIEILKDGTKNTKGKIWNICLVIISCDKPPSKSNILDENLLEGGLKLSLWEIK